jgi:hypothetical protein
MWINLKGNPTNIALFRIIPNKNKQKFSYKKRPDYAGLSSII